MNCEETRLRLQESLDGGPRTPEVEHHVDLCEDCRGYAERLGRVDDWLEGEPELEWSVRLTAEVMRRVRRGRAWSLWWGAAAAAMLLLAVWLGAELLREVPAAERAGRTLSVHLPLPESAGAALDDLGADVEGLASGAEEVAGGSTLAAGSLWIIAGLLALLAFDGLKLGRTVLARRRES